MLICLTHLFEVERWNSRQIIYRAKDDAVLILHIAGLCEVNPVLTELGERRCFLRVLPCMRGVQKSASTPQEIRQNSSNNGKLFKVAMSCFATMPRQ